MQKPKELEEDSKYSYESLESVSIRMAAALYPNTLHLLYVDRLHVSQENQSLQKDNDTLRKKLKEAEREVEILKTLLKRHALHPVEEDSSS